MDELYILRHGIAVEPGTPGIADDDRPLTPRGRKRLREIACGLRRLDLRLDLVVTSPLPRALATAEIVAGALESAHGLETADVLRSGSDARAIRDWLLPRAEARLMIVGHNPSLTDLIALLVLGDDDARPQVCDLKKGGIAALRPTSTLPGCFELAWMATPRLIRRLSGAGHRPHKKS